MFIGCQSSGESLRRPTSSLYLSVYVIQIGQAPQYLTDCVTTVSAAGARYRLRLTDTCSGLRSAITITKYGKHGLCYSGPATWNSLPSDLPRLSVPTLYPFSSPVASPSKHTPNPTREFRGEHFKLSWRFRSEPARMMKISTVLCLQKERIW